MRALMTSFGRFVQPSRRPATISLLLITTQQGISLFTSRPSQAEALSRDNNFSTLVSGLALTIKRSCPGCGWMRSSRPGEVTAAQ